MNIVRVNGKRINIPNGHSVNIINGDVDAGGSVTCGNVSGSIDAGGSVIRR